MDKAHVAKSRFLANMSHEIQTLMNKESAPSVPIEVKRVLPDMNAGAECASKEDLTKTIQALSVFTSGYTANVIAH